MKYEKGDIVWVNFEILDQSRKPHMAVVVSSNELQEATGDIYLCMISSKHYYDDYCIEITNDMLYNFKLDKASYVVCHLLTGFTEDTIIQKLGRMKKEYVSKLVDKIIKTIFFDVSE